MSSIDRDFRWIGEERANRLNKALAESQITHISVSANAYQLITGVIVKRQFDSALDIESLAKRLEEKYKIITPLVVGIGPTGFVIRVDLCKECVGNWLVLRGAAGRLLL